MQSVFSLVHRAALVVAGALALGACSRAEYAMLPKSPAYLGTKSAAAVAPRPAAQPTAVAAASAPAAPVAAPAPAAVANVVPRPAAVAKATPAATPAPSAPTPTEAAATVATSAPAAAPAAPKLNLVQRLALKKISKKLDKLTANSPQFKQRDATASTARINGNLRTGIILLIIGLLVGLLNGLIGTIIAIVGLIFIVLWLLDEL